jgi:Holliday junction resolvase-like predicted endonuclease
VSKQDRLDAQETGRRGEELALELARDRGWQPWLGNVPIAGHEADLVCMRQGRDGREGLLLEVKTTRDARADLAPRLGLAQQKRLWRMAEVLVEQHDLHAIEVAVVLVRLQPDREHALWIPLEAY